MKVYPRAGWIIVMMLVGSLGFFIAGIFLPFTAVTKLWLFKNQVSVYRGLIVLWHAGELFLFLILFVFTILFPFVKINSMLGLWLWPRLGREQAQCVYHFVSNLGKWSMLDVFVLAILVLTVNPAAWRTSRSAAVFSSSSFPSCSRRPPRSGPAKSFPAWTNERTRERSAS